MVEDGALAHTSHVAKVAQTQLGIHTLTHLLNSPNLNPIEPIWKILKDHIAQIPGSHNSLSQLWTIAQCVWKELMIEEI